MPRAPKTQLPPALRRAAVIRTPEIQRSGMSRIALRDAVARGLLTRLGRGVYAVEGASPTEHHGLAQAAARVPGGIVCLLSALVFHGLTTQTPHEVWLAIDRKSRRPVAGFPPLRIVRFGGPAFTTGTLVERIEGVDVRITTPAKTVADCFKYRNKTGVSIAIEALRDGWSQRRFTMDELWDMARICRVTNVIRPYLESMT